jgi:flagellar motor switch protein FliN/FliY
MADDPLMSQDEIERLLSQASSLSGQEEAQGAAAMAPAAPPHDDGPRSAQGQAPPRRPESSASAAHSAAASPARTPAPDPDLAAGDIDYLLSQAERALESATAVHDGGLPPGVSPYSLEEFSPAAAGTEVATLELVRDVELDVKIELGRTQMYLEDVLKLRKGSVVPLDKLAGDPVDVYVNGRLVARGEVLVLNDNFCVRVAELVVGTGATG